MAVTACTSTLTAAGLTPDAATVCPAVWPGDAVVVGAGGRLVDAGVGDDGDPHVATTTAMTRQARGRGADDTSAS